MADVQYVREVRVTAERKRRNAWAEFFTRLVKEKPLGTVGLVIVVILCLVAIFADVLAPYGYNEIILADRLSAPSPKHWLGCDNLGRDLLSRVIYGSRVSMIVAIAGSALSAVVGFFLGCSSGFIGGKFDMVVQRFVDAWMSIPGLVLYLIIMSLLGGGLTQVVLVLGISGGLGGGSRMTRSFVTAIKENVYFEAARAIGLSNFKILLRHVLPNVLPMMIIGFSMGLGGMVLAEAALSFLGFGIPPPMPSWGGMLSGPGRTYMLQAPWMALWPGLALSILVFAVNMLGDAVRDLFDPRLRGGLGRYGGITQEKLEKMVAKKKAELAKLQS